LFPAFQIVELDVFPPSLGETAFFAEPLEFSVYTARITGTLDPVFVRGDCDGSGDLDIGDVTFVLRYRFQESTRAPGREACNVDDSGKKGVTDAVYLASHLFRDGPSPPEPFPEAGTERGRVTR